MVVWKQKAQDFTDAGKIGARVSEHEKPDMAEKSYVLQLATGKYNLYKRCDEQISFAFIAALIMLAVSKYGKVFTIPDSAAMTVFAVLAVAGVWAIIKKRVWRQRMARLEHQMKGNCCEKN